jgi:hypothetical protein
MYKILLVNQQLNMLRKFYSPWFNPVNIKVIITMYENLLCHLARLLEPFMEEWNLFLVITTDVVSVHLLAHLSSKCTNWIYLYLFNVTDNSTKLDSVEWSGDNKQLTRKDVEGSGRGII